ncbi:MAG: hypothetical protein LBV47_08680 [Bacteroidales bacterium]|nr:hypothetical protein [Bacteroidales bacterium]
MERSSKFQIISGKDKKSSYKNDKSRQIKARCMFSAMGCMPVVWPLRGLLKL